MTCSEKLLKKLSETIPCCGCLKNKYEEPNETILEVSQAKKKRNSKFGKWKKRSDPISLIQQNSKCGVCQMQRPNAITNCGDPLHLRCIIEYIKYNSVCPTCFLPNYNPVKFFCKVCSIKYF